MTPQELYAEYPFNYDNYMGFLRLYVTLLGSGPSAEELDLANAYNHDNYIEWIGRAWVLGAEPPSAIESEIEANWIVNQAITPIDFSTNFTGIVESYGMTVIPEGLAFDTNTGILSGTPTSQGGGRPGVIAYGRELNASCILDYSVGVA